MRHDCVESDSALSRDVIRSRLHPRCIGLSGRVTIVVLAFVVSYPTGYRVAAQRGGQEPSTLAWHEAYERGLEAIRRADWPNAIANLEVAKAKGPAPGRNVLYYGSLRRPFIPDYYLGRAFFETRRFDEANAAFSRVLQQNLIRPSDPEYPALQREIKLTRAEIQRSSSSQQPPPTDAKPPVDRQPPAPTPRPEPLPPSTSAGKLPRPPMYPEPVNLDAFRLYSKQLVEGVVGFDYPPTMTVGDRTDVRLRVSVQKAVQELRESLKREGRDPIVEPAKVSPRMKAELQGFGFEVKPLNSVEQVIAADEDTTWAWNVRATEPGKQRLSVTLTAIVDVKNSEVTRDVSSFYRDVEVVAVPKTWWESTRDAAKEYGPSRDVVWPAIPTVAAAVWAFLFARRKAKSKRSRRK